MFKLNALFRAAPEVNRHRMSRLVWGGLLAALVGLVTTTSPAAPYTVVPEAACLAAITRIEADTLLPPQLLRGIARVESGRPGVALAWPWTVNAEGRGYYLDTKDEAIALVQTLQRQNVRSIDVGCMQVNLMHHPHAFPSLDDAFDPERNIRYAAQFLRWLRAESGDWDGAVARYHSGDPVRGADYRRRVAAAGATMMGADFDGALVLTLAEIRQGPTFRQALALQQQSTGARARGGRPQRIVILGDGTRAGEGGAR